MVRMRRIRIERVGLENSLGSRIGMVTFKREREEYEMRQTSKI